MWQITFPPHPFPLVTEKAETTKCFSICESQSHLAREILLCEQRRTDHRRVPKDNHIFEYPWNLVWWQNTTRVSLKKFSQLNSDIQSYCCKDFSLKQVSGLMATPRAIPLDLPLLWCPLISFFLQHSVIRTHQLLAIDARSELAFSRVG